MQVFVYFNLKKKMFSIRDSVTNLVVAHADTVALTNAQFKVSEKGRQRVLREKRKNVHAGVKGKLVGFEGTLTGQASRLANDMEVWQFPEGTFNRGFKVGSVGVTYNPYKGDSFVRLDTFEPVGFSEKALLTGKTVLIPTTE